ncbi:MAG: NAD(P)H-dependent glycerol-3-phosphate dehydrogenase [Eubacteriales bacterium]
MMRITVAGCGRWGSLIAWYLDRCGHDVTMYGRRDSENMKKFLQSGTNGLIQMPESVKLCTDISSVSDAEAVIIAIASQSLRAFLAQIRALGVRNRIFVLCMKGIELDTTKRLSEIASESLDPSNRVAVWLGPGHVQEFYAGIPNCMVIDSTDDEVKRLLVSEFSSDLIRFYYGQDMIGNEIGAASKNVIGIAAGMLDGIGLSTLKGALMSRGTREIARLISDMGGNELSAYGLCHLGDYEATVFSEYSHNRRFGEAFVRGEEYAELAEGYYTAKSMHQLAQKYGTQLPICEAVYRILYEGADVRQTLDSLFHRSIKNEFERSISL